VRFAYGDNTEEYYERHILFYFHKCKSLPDAQVPSDEWSPIQFRIQKSKVLSVPKAQDSWFGRSYVQMWLSVQEVLLPVPATTINFDPVRVPLHPELLISGLFSPESASILFLFRMNESGLPIDMHEITVRMESRSGSVTRVGSGFVTDKLRVLVRFPPGDVARIAAASNTAIAIFVGVSERYTGDCVPFSLIKHENDWILHFLRFVVPIFVENRNRSGELFVDLALKWLANFSLSDDKQRTVDVDVLLVNLCLCVWEPPPMVTLENVRYVVESFFRDDCVQTLRSVPEVDFQSRLSPSTEIAVLQVDTGSAALKDVWKLGLVLGSMSDGTVRLWGPDLCDQPAGVSKAYEIWRKGGS
jgi:hypothetical protein